MEAGLWRPSARVLAVVALVDALALAALSYGAISKNLARSARSGRARGRPRTRADRPQPEDTPG